MQSVFHELNNPLSFIENNGLFKFYKGKGKIVSTQTGYLKK